MLVSAFACTDGGRSRWGMCTGVYSCTTKELESRSQRQYDGDDGVEERRATGVAPGARERQTGSRWQSGAAGLRAKLQQRASATMPKFRVLLNPDTDNDFFSLLTLALHVCSFHLDSVFSVTYACDRGRSWWESRRCNGAGG
jgi:hypothetical protein